MTIVIVLLLMLCIGLMTARSYETYYEIRLADIERRLLDLELDPACKCNRGDHK